MKIIPCPINGPRPVSEFVYGGPVREMPDPQTATDAQWADYVFNRDGAPGVKHEWWYHAPSGTWLVVVRDTVADAIERVYLPGREDGR